MATLLAGEYDKAALDWIKSIFPNQPLDVWHAAYKYGCIDYWLKGGTHRDRFKREVDRFFFLHRQDPDFYKTV